MSPSAVIFSSDQVRGNITSRKLRHEGFRTTLFDRVASAVDEAAASGTRVFIFDTAGAIADELRFLSRFYDSWPDDLELLVVLGDQPPEFHGPPRRGEVQVLPDPLDLDRVAALAKQAYSGPADAAPRAEENDLESDLKDFLRLR